MDNDKWLTTAEVASRLGFSSRWVEDQVELGRLRAVAYTAGKRRVLRFHRAEVERFRTAHFRDARTGEPLA